MRKIELVVGNKQINTGFTWAYPAGQHHGIFLIPIYELTVSGKNAEGQNLSRKFEVFRFGVSCPTAKSQPKVVGLADSQTHVIKAWLPNYTVHSASSLEKGAWQVYDSFLIHDGPDDPKKEIYASIGCVEICNGPQGFDDFNDFLIQLSGASASSRAEQLKQIGQASNMRITYLKAARPPLVLRKI